MTRDWTTAVVDVLGAIALKLDPEDLVKFSLVCHSWNQAYLMVKPQWTAKTPLLLLAEVLENNPRCVRTIFNLEKNKCHRLKLPEMYGATCWGSAYGWIVTFHVDMRISLFNPLTKATLSLPRQSAMPDQVKCRKIRYCKPTGREWYRTWWIRKAIVLKDNDNNDSSSNADSDLIVFAIHCSHRKQLAFARPGDKKWTQVIPPEGCFHVQDVMRWGTQIIILYSTGTLGCFNISYTRKTPRLLSVEAEVYLHPSPEIVRYGVRVNPTLYLLDSYGDLLMVIRSRTHRSRTQRTVNGDIPYLTTCFEVYKLDFNTQTWDRVYDLGNVSLVVGHNSSMPIFISNCQNFRQNCIYYTDDETDLWVGTSLMGGCDFGMFDIEKNEFGEAFYDGEDCNSDYCGPIWFMPQI